MGDIGALRYRIVLQTRSAGAGAVTWSNTASTWAEVRSLAPTYPEDASPSAVRSTVQYIVRVRNRTVVPEQRIVWNNQTLQVLSVRPLDRQYLEVLCSEVQ